MKVAQPLILLATLSISCNAVTTVAIIASDVTNMIAQAKSLEQTFNGLNSYNWMFSGPSLHSGVESVSSGLANAADDITEMNLPLSEADATTLFNAAAPMYSLAGQFAQSALSRKQDLTKLPVVGSFSSAMMLTEIKTIQGAVDNFSSVMMKATPASLATNATNLKAVVDNAMTSAINSYSS